MHRAACLADRRLMDDVEMYSTLLNLTLKENKSVFKTISGVYQWQAFIFDPSSVLKFIGCSFLVRWKLLRSQQLWYLALESNRYVDD